MPFAYLRRCRGNTTNFAFDKDGVGGLEVLVHTL